METILKPDPSSYGEQDLVHHHEKRHSNSGPPRSSIREIRASVSTQRAITAASQDHVTQPKPSKRKALLLGGLFQKEPSMVALEQFTADMQVQRSSKPGKPTPFVSSQKMPGHVPKVNSKWDGVPEAVRQKEKDKTRLKRASLAMPALNGLRIAGLDFSSPDRRRNSVAESWDSRSSGSRPIVEDAPYRGASSTYTCSSSGSTHRRCMTGDWSNPGLQDSETSVPHEGSTTSPRNTHLVMNTGSIQNGTRNDTFSTPIVSIPEHITSTLSSPLEQSPQTPESSYTPSKPRSAHVGISLQDDTHPSVDAFLAGEAHPVELPDENTSSLKPPRHQPTTLRKLQMTSAGRFRYGHRPRNGGNRAIQEDVVPWEAFDTTHGAYTGHQARIIDASDR